MELPTDPSTCCWCDERRVSRRAQFPKNRAADITFASPADLRPKVFRFAWRRATPFHSAAKPCSIQQGVPKAPERERSVGLHSHFLEIGFFLAKRSGEHSL